ncbi:hypothetical protein D3C80_2020690 [compost metagenome]
MIAWEQQHRPVAWRLQQLNEVFEHLANAQLGIDQAKGGQAGGIQGVRAFTGVLQQDHAGAAVERGDQWA